MAGNEWIWSRYNATMQMTVEQGEHYLMSEQEEKNIATVRAMLEAFERLDMGALPKLFHPDIVVEFPYNDDNGRIEGRDAASDYLGTSIPAMFKSLSFTIDAVYPAKDGEHLILEYHSTGVLAPNDAPYANRYVGIFRVVDGQIALFKEYYNNLAVAAAQDSG